jgi:predicted transposase YdaD
MITMGLTLDPIAQATDLSFEKVQQLAEEQEHK